ncbi:protein of unknown function [Candidatus Methylomirabilis oxygeniifera]|uniref:Uncharacterized protein n=1 Tax=Methylomirabilis oxygeniifera TaxID=671143 RepID=D5MIJ2_METO1|nr:protein of unknown function [Candidatus Methylomirabilis oxyfera]
MNPLGVHYKIPLFQRGKRLVPLFGKEGLGEIFHP